MGQFSDRRYFVVYCVKTCKNHSRRCTATPFWFATPAGANVIGAIHSDCQATFSDANPGIRVFPALALTSPDSGSHPAYARAAAGPYIPESQKYERKRRTPE
jgi:hypothetical protein